MDQVQGSWRGAPESESRTIIQYDMKLELENRVQVVVPKKPIPPFSCGEIWRDPNDESVMMVTNVVKSEGRGLVNLATGSMHYVTDRNHVLELVCSVAQITVQEVDSESQPE